MIYQLREKIRLSEIQAFSQVNLESLPDMLIGSVSSFDSASDNCISFLSQPQELKNDSKFVLIGKERPANFLGLFVKSNNPRLDFVRVLSWLEKNVGFNLNHFSQISTTAIIDRTAVIMSGVVVGDNTEIGPNVVLMSGVRIGENTRIGAGTVLGDEGFGFVRDEDSSINRFIHLGGVQVGDDVVIGNNCTIARGVLSDTIIENSVKIDNLVHVAHGVKIGKRTLIAASTEISGSVTVGQNVWIGPGCVITNGIEIQDEAVIGLGSVVTKNIRSKEKVFGNPARVLPY